MSMYNQTTPSLPSSLVEMALRFFRSVYHSTPSEGMEEVLFVSTASREA